MNSHSTLKILNLRENNLKDLNLEIPHDSVTVICGPSGSGKSTLAFDAIYAEGARRYVETFDPYTRQFLDRLKAPDASLIENVRPGLALEQRNRVTSSRSTVGTVTEINDYLKILWSENSYLECPSCGQIIKKYSPEDVVQKLSELDSEKANILLSFRIQVSKLSLNSLVDTMKSSGFSRILTSDHKVKKLDDLDAEDVKRKYIDIVVDRILVQNPVEIISNKKTKSRFLSSISQCYEFGKQELQVFVEDADAKLKSIKFANKYYCSTCEKNFPLPSPSLFSFNSPIGACDECKGFGKILKIDVKKIIPNVNLSLSQGAIACWQGELGKKQKGFLRKFCEENSIPFDLSWSKLSDSQVEKILHGDKKKNSSFKGLFPWFEIIAQKRHKMHIRIFVAKHRSEFICPSCDGSRLVKESLFFKIASKNIFEITNLPIDELYNFIGNIVVIDELSIIKKEIVTRLKYLIDVGLPYLSLNRQTKTLSGGEFQRVNLTTLLGANLVNSMFVLDEPTIGLHPRDTKLLIEAIRDLASRGNSLIVVEHDPDVISDADNLIELGPDSGSKGGEIVFHGSPSELLSAKTKTALYFKNQENEVQYSKLSNKSAGDIQIKNARSNNLKDVCLNLPLNKFIVLAGVSGSGKSTLINNCLFRAYKDAGAVKSISTDYVSIKGLDKIKEIVLIDQQPIGKSSRANSATYTKVWDDFREYFSETDAALAAGLTKSSFSFNVEGGRCPFCKGNGTIKIEMQFLTDVEIECEVCLGRRFRDQVLAITLGGKNVIELLATPINDVTAYVESLPSEKRNASIIKGLMPLIDLGLGYVTLGQSLSNLSGGEAQRLKLASFLKGKSSERIFILDEPTTGLHPSDISVLLNALQSIVNAGNTVVCIEHNLDVIKSADWLIELGPEGGIGGGEVVLEGIPKELIHNKKISSATILSLRENKEIRNVGPRKNLKISEKPKAIKIIGAREHNLKNISVEIPQDKLCVITGLSGSGKSTLAFDILFSEGQRRFIDCLSPYARQYISQSNKPDVDLVEGLPPTIAVSQKIAPPSGVSTLATVTEIYQFLRLLYAKTGTQHCVKDGSVISNYNQSLIVDEMISLFEGKTVYVFSPIVQGRKGHYREVFQRALLAELTHARIDGEYRKITEDLKLERHKLHWISLEIGKMKVGKKNADLLNHAISQSLMMSQGSVEVVVEDPYSKPRVFSVDRVCPTCKKAYLPLDPQDFSFRSERGMCTLCKGHGKIETLSQRSFKICPECNGARVGEIARNVKIAGSTIYDLTKLKSKELNCFFEKWDYPTRQQPIILPILKELHSLLKMIDEIGLGYLTMDRDASTLSGGEAQRLRLAKNLGAPLTGVCYVLDEPSIGLHSADHENLMLTLKKIRDQGNTVVVVEHDEDTIVESDYIIDIGPNAGTEGGNIVFTGEFKELLNCSNSKTAQAFLLRGEASFAPKVADFKTNEVISLSGAKANNLKSINVDFPIGALICVVGVSGAGKSSLVYSTLVPSIIEEFEGAREREKFYDKTWEGLASGKSVDRMIEIDQKPIGKTPSSTPASFLGLFNEIRKLFESLPDAKVRGFNASHFSYNTGKGRCQVCEGRGYIKIPMSFLPDEMSECEACQGLRYNQETLEVKYNGFSIGDILKLTMNEAREVLIHFSKIKNILEYVCELGIGYLSLGQASHTLSGGEAQRLKIVREISAKDSSSCLYLLDEPTIGLHMLDVKKLVSVSRKLVAKGNTVVVIEHNFDVLLNSDYVIDIGPGPGEMGGNLMFQGSLKDYLKSKKKSPTKDQLNKYLLHANVTSNFENNLKRFNG